MGNLELWYCTNIVYGPWPYLLLGLPLIGAYLYGQGKKRLSWILIGLWIPIHLTLSYFNNIVVTCPGDVPYPGQQPQQEAPATPPVPAPDAK